MGNFLNQLGIFFRSISGFLWGVALILIAWILATVLKNVISKGLKKTRFPMKLAEWRVVTSPDEGLNFIDSFSKVIYYLVWVLFLPAIFNQFGMTSVGQPISNMLDQILVFLPKLFAAILIIAIGVIVARFVKNLVYNLALTMNVERWGRKVWGEDSNPEAHKGNLAQVLGNIVLVLVLIPFIVVALETLQIKSITTPVVEVLNQILAAVPRIFVALILLAIGYVLAKLVANLLGRLLENVGVNRLTNHLNHPKAKGFNLAKVISQVVGGIILLFFLVEALNALKFQVLQTIGAAIIVYIPNVLVALIILGLGFIGGSALAKFIRENFNSAALGVVTQATLSVLSAFMALDQLKFANRIVNIAFILVLGALAVAFAISFGIGGRDFASKQLSKLDKKMDEESEKVSQAIESKNQDNINF